MIYGYVRVSTIEQANGGSSLDAQKNQIAGYCQMHGWTEPPVFIIENAVSGSVPLANRPEGGRMLDGLYSGDAVVITKLDRMFRNASDALTVLGHLKDGGVSLHMIDLGGDVTGNGISKLVFTILAAVAEAERERIQERIREVKQDMKLRGLHHGGPRPYGWKVEHKRYVPVPEEQAWVKRIRDLKAEGKRDYTITTILKQEGGPAFQATQVKRILNRTGVLAE